MGPSPLYNPRIPSSNLILLIVPNENTICFNALVGLSDSAGTTHSASVFEAVYALIL